MFPLIQNWIDNPQPSEIATVMGELDKILPKASEFLGKLPKPTDGVEPCKSGLRRRDLEELEDLELHRFQKRTFLDGLFKTAFSLVTCVIDGTNKVKSGVINGATEVVKSLSEDLKPMVEALNKVDPTEEPRPSASISDQQGSSQSESSSSSSCTLRTVSDCNIACTATAITTVGGIRKRAEGDSCTTVCGSPVTRCDATGVTTASTVTSTSSAFQRCSPDCAGCNANGRPPRPQRSDLGTYSTATNGVLFLPAQTVTELPSDEAVAARGVTPRETGSPSSNYKRALTNPNDDRFRGNVGAWLLVQVTCSPNDLNHGAAPGVFSTGFTFPLLGYWDTWNLVDLYGCTSVIVVSRKRVFMTHIWETPSMEDTNNLQQHILGPLRNGDAGIPQGLTAFTGVGGDFENTPQNKVRAFIITPNRRLVENPDYDDLEFDYEVRKIKEELNDILGRSDTVHIPYIARAPDPNRNTPFGKVLVQYDPAQAWLGREDGSCNTQVARLEIWFEDSPRYRYRDTWEAFPNQYLLGPEPMGAVGAALANGKMKRLIRGREVTDADEEEWKEYAALMKRQNDGVCFMSSATLSASSTSPPSSTTQDPTTLQTSIIPSSSALETPSASGSPPPSETPSPTEPSSPSDTPSPTPAPEPSTATEEPLPPATQTPEPPAPEQPKGPPKSLQVIYETLIDTGAGDDWFWNFYEGEQGVAVDPCSDPLLSDDKAPENRGYDAPWPNGEWKLRFAGYAEDCTFQGIGTKGPSGDVGWLHCPERPAIMCLEDPKKAGGKDAWTNCETGDWSKDFLPVAYCDWS